MYVLQLKVSVPGNTPEVDEETTAPKNASALVAMIRAFGEERLTALSPAVAPKLPRLSELSDAQVESLAAVDCAQCTERLPSILVSSNQAYAGFCNAAGIISPLAQNEMDTVFFTDR